MNLVIRDGSDVERVPSLTSVQKSSQSVCHPDVCTMHFVGFYYVCRTNAQCILTVSVSYSIATCFDIYTSSSGSLLLCTQK